MSFKLENRKGRRENLFQNSTVSKNKVLMMIHDVYSGLRYMRFRGEKEKLE
jgi:hypothetical protein